MSKTVEQYPEGALIYFHPDKNLHPGLKNVFQQALPDHLTIITDMTPMVYAYPADVGMQLGDTFYGFSIGETYVRRCLEESLGEQKTEELEASLPVFKCGNFPHLDYYHQEGGLRVPIAGSNRVITVFPLEGELDFLRKKGVDPIHPPNLLNGIKQLATSDECLERDRSLYKGHIDLVLTGVAEPEKDTVYMDELLKGFLQERKILDECLEDSQPIEHSLVRRGACNIKTIETARRRVALVPSQEIIGPIAPALERAEFDIFELGEDQMGAGGIKCRSLNIRWRK